MLTLMRAMFYAMICLLPRLFELLLRRADVCALHATRADAAASAPRLRRFATTI